MVDRMEVVVAIRQRIISKSAAKGPVAMPPARKAVGKDARPGAAAPKGRSGERAASPKTAEVKVLQDWYSSEDAKRSLGFICQAVNEQGVTIGLMGSREEPQLHIVDVDLYDDEYDEIITLEEARANWSAVTLAAAIMGSRFRIDGRKQPRVALIANTAAPHPALRFKRPQSPETRAVADRLEDVLNEIRRLDNRIGTAGEHAVMSELVGLADRIDRSADVIERRFRAIWRDAEGHPVC